MEAILGAVLLTTVTFLLLQPPAVSPASPAGVGSTCEVPPYSQPLHEVNVTAENEALLLAEGRCYLACLREGFSYHVRVVKLQPRPQF